MDPSVVVSKANLITLASTAETQVFRQVLLALGGVATVKQVVPKVAAYQFEEQLTTPAPSVGVGPNKSGQSGMSAGLIVLIVVLVLLCLVIVVVGFVVIKRKLEAEKRCAAPRQDMRQGDLEAGNATNVREPSHTLLDGDAHDAKKSEGIMHI